MALPSFCYFNAGSNDWKQETEILERWSLGQNLRCGRKSPTSLTLPPPKHTYTTTTQAMEKSKRQKVAVERGKRRDSGICGGQIGLPCDWEGSRPGRCRRPVGHWWWWRNRPLPTWWGPVLLPPERNQGPKNSPKWKAEQWLWMPASCQNQYTAWCYSSQLHGSWQWFLSHTAMVLLLLQGFRT